MKLIELSPVIRLLGHSTKVGSPGFEPSSLWRYLPRPIFFRSILNNNESHSHQSVHYNLTQVYRRRPKGKKRPVYSKAFIFSKTFAISCLRIRFFSLTDLAWFEPLSACSTAWFSMALFIDCKSGIRSISAPHSHLMVWRPFLELVFVRVSLPHYRLWAFE